MFQQLKMNWIDLLNTGGAVVLITTVSNAIVKQVEKRQRYKKAIGKISEIYDVFNRVIDDSNADRVLILKGSNGGGRPTIGSNLYVSVLHEMSVKGIEQIKGQYQNILVDDAYIRLMQKLIETREIEIQTKELPENSFVRLTYEKENLKHSYLYEIKANANTYFFGSFSTKETGGFSPSDKLAFRLAIDKIKKIFENEN